MWGGEGGPLAQPLLAVTVLEQGRVAEGGSLGAPGGSRQGQRLVAGRPLTPVQPDAGAMPSSGSRLCRGVWTRGV